MVPSTVNLHSNLQLSVEQPHFEWKARMAVTFNVLKWLCYKDIALFGLFSASLSHNFIVYLPIIHTHPKNVHVFFGNLFITFSGTPLKLEKIC